MTQKTTRRGFLQTTAAVGAGYFVAGTTKDVFARQGANERLNIAIVGAGGRGAGNLGSVARTENIVALCDVDERRARDAFNRYQNVPKFDDFRVMLDRVRNIDAVVVSTPDHTHAIAAITAMKMGKHAYVEKPLTHSVWEARQMKLEAERNRVITQMGNQGTASDGLREGVEVVQAGRLGPVREVHVWTNRPIWPQGIARPEGQQEVPNGLAWDKWLGPAPERPYNSAYLPFNWRGWVDFGTGAVGDMACHTMNLPFMALRLAPPTRVSAELRGEFNRETYPVGCTVTLNFAARGDAPPVTMKWYERGLPPRELFQGQNPSGSGCLIIGENLTMYSPSDYGGEYRLLRNNEVVRMEPPERTLPRVGGNHHGEWLNGIRNNRQPMSNFPGYASALTETALLGNVAIMSGRPFNWNSAELRANNEQAQQYIRREYRRGWTL